MIREKYDVIIVGAGPAGIFAALELCRQDRARILLLDKGASLEKRKCATLGLSLIHICHPTTAVTSQPRRWTNRHPP